MRGASQTMVRSRCAIWPPRCVHPLDREFQELVGRGAAPVRIVRREMLADVAVGERAEDGVDQRVQRDVGVRMPGQPAVVRNSRRRRARHDRRRRRRARRSRCRERRSARLAIRRASALAKSSSVVSFTLPVSPAKCRDLDARPFGERGVVGEIVAAFAWRRDDAPPATPRIRTPAASARRAAARDRAVPATWPPASTRLIVSVTSSAGMAAPVSPQADDGARNKLGRAERPRRVVDEHDVGGARAERFEAGPHRRLPRRAARHRGQEPQAFGGRLVGAAVVRMDDRLHRADLAVPGEQRQARTDHRFAGQLRGIAWANRRRREAPARRRRSRRRQRGPLHIPT